MASRDGIYVINLRSTWKQLLLMAPAIVVTEDVADGRVTCSRNTGQGDRLKFAAATRTSPTVGCLASGNFTSQIQAASQEPHFLMVTDPSADHHPLKDTSYSNLCISLYVT